MAPDPVEQNGNRLELPFGHSANKASVSRHRKVPEAIASAEAKAGPPEKRKRSPKSCSLTRRSSSNDCWSVRFFLSCTPKQR